MQNLNQASKKSISQLGTPKEDFNLNEVYSTIEEALNEFILAVVENINNANVIDTGDIANISYTNNNGEFEVKASKQLIFQSWGVDGTGPGGDRPVVTGTPFKFKTGSSADVFVEWARRKGFENPEKAAWGIRNNVTRYGITPKNLYQEEVDKLINKLGEEVANAILGQLKVPPVTIEKTIGGGK